MCLYSLTQKDLAARLFQRTADENEIKFDHVCTGYHKKPADKARHDKTVSLADRMLELHKRSLRLPQEQEMVRREVESTDKQIDNLVYELYGLTEEEIKTVEG